MMKRETVKYFSLSIQAQIVLLFILLAAMADFLIGSLIPPSSQQMAKGFVGWRGKFTFLNVTVCFY